MEIAVTGLMNTSLDEKKININSCFHTANSLGFYSGSGRSRATKKRLRTSWNMSLSKVRLSF